MSTSTRVATAMTWLSAGLEHPDNDLVARLVDFTAAAEASVSSYLGLLVWVGESATTIEFTWGPKLPAETGVPIPAGASLQIEFAGSRESGPTVRIVLYAARPGAFVDLMADLSWLTGHLSNQFILDAHVDGAVTRGNLQQVATDSIINQAIGVLIEGGLTPSEAEAELTSGIANTLADRGARAARVLAGLPTHPPDEPSA